MEEEEEEGIIDWWRWEMGMGDGNGNGIGIGKMHLRRCQEDEKDEVELTW